MKLPVLRKIDPNTLVMLKQIGLGVLVISVVALILTGVWFGARMDSLTLTKTEVFGGQTISHELVSDLALQQLEGEYAGFIPRSFAWLYPRQDIIDVVSMVNRIHSVGVDTTDWNTVHITFEEYLPEALWCKTLLALECVFVDDSGFAYSTSPDLTGGSMLRFIHTSKDPKIGELLTSPEDFVLLKQLADLLVENGWFVSHIEIDKVRDAFLHIVDGGELKVTLTQPPQDTVDNLNVVLTSDEFKELEPGNFQYIDLRFGNKVFINEEDFVAEAATSTEDILDVESDSQEGESVEE
jgi:hypothetical protein